MIGIVHDPRLFARHDDPTHPENARRLVGWSPPPGLQHLPARAATDAELLTVHTAAHIRRLQEVCSAGGGPLDPDTYSGPESESVVRCGVGGLLDLSVAVWAGKLDAGLAVIRPPGHHALPEQTMGFCLYNGIAVAARAVRAAGAGPVAILDFDVHHGNGTQDVFYDDGSVFFASSHQFPHWPGTGRADEKGSGAGVGTNLNVPLDPGSGDVPFTAAWRENIIPAARAFAPEMILVSAGFDAHAADLLADLEVSTAGLGEVVGLILDLAAEVAGGRVVFVLEGGYDPGALRQGLDGLTRQLIARY